MISMFTFQTLCVLSAIFGLFLNSFILFIIFCSSLTRNNLLILLMGLVDILFSLVIIIGNILNFLIINNVNYHPSALDVQIGCKIQGSLSTLFSLFILWIVCGVIIDRYIAIVKPFNYSKLLTTKKVAKWILLIWTLCTIFIIVPMFVPMFVPVSNFCQYNYSSYRSSCIIVCSSTENEIYLKVIKTVYLILYCIITIFPMIIILTCNLHILMIARYHHHRIVSAIFEITSRQQIIINSNQDISFLPKNRTSETFSTLFQLIGSIIILTLPYYVIYFYETFTGTKVNSYMTLFSSFLFILTPTVNAYVYGIKSKTLKKAFKRLLQRFLFKQQASLEIDRRLSLRSQSSLRIVEGLCSFLSTSSNSSNSLNNYNTKGQRRYSAPSNCDEIQNSVIYYMRRQSWTLDCDKSDISLQHSLCQSQNQCKLITNLSRRPSFLAESKVINMNKSILSPIQEISHGIIGDCPTVAII